MTGGELRKARLARGWTQTEAAKKFRVTQAYLSMMEQGVRPVPLAIARKLVASGQVRATALPLEPVCDLDNETLIDELGALGYPGFAYVRAKPRLHPATFLLSALTKGDLYSRVTEGLPWVAYAYADMDWTWLVREAKLLDVQNRLGFIIDVALAVADKWNDVTARERLLRVREHLDRARLAREDTLSHDSLSQPERRWLRENRPREAAYWNLLTDIEVEQLTHALP